MEGSHPIPQDAGKALADKHMKELNEGIDAHGGADAPAAVMFMMAYMQGLKDAQEGLQA